jgi:chromosome segregation ATPase
LQVGPPVRHRNARGANDGARLRATNPRIHASDFEPAPTAVSFETALYHLPPYVALSRWVDRRRVLVVAPGDEAGVRRLLTAGARVTVVGGDVRLDGVERHDGVPRLPVADAVFDLVLCVEVFGGLDDEERAKLIREARRVLVPGGAFATWIPEDDEGGLDFYALEEALTSTFEHVCMLAQMPWSGVSLAPVLDEGVSTIPDVALSEVLLDVPPSATHYLGVASGSITGFASELLEQLVRECLLVPLPTSEAAGELEALREQLGEGAEAHARLSAELLEHQRIFAEEQEERRRLTTELEDARDALRRLRDELETRRASVVELEDGLESARRQAATMTEQLHEARAEAQRLVTAKRTLERDLERLQTELARLRSESSTLVEAREALQHQADRLARENADLQGRVERAQSRIDELTQAERAADERARSKETDLAVLTRTVAELERALARASEQSEARARELETRARAVAELRAELDAAKTERVDLERQLELARSERTGAQQLANRAETELELTRRRLESQEEQLVGKLEEASRLAAEVQVLRERLQHQSSAMEALRAREEELKSSVARGAEQGRMLSEVAFDRDRLREELTKRAQEIRKLEERLWSMRDDVQKERLENVRLGGEVERLREGLQRSHTVEASRAEEVERLSAELRQLETKQAELAGLLRARDDETERLRAEIQALSSESEGLEELRRELARRGDELGRLRVELEQARGREKDASAQTRRREEQLSSAGAELEALRKSAEDNAGLAATLQGELDVKALEVEQLAASVADLQGELEAQRSSFTDKDAHAVALQRQLEQTAAEREHLRARLREREQELEDLTSSHESSDVELFKLRRELEEAARKNERLEDVAELGAGASAELERDETTGWPEAARASIRRLQAQLAAQGRRHAEQLAVRDAAMVDGSPADRARMARLQLEIDVRAEEQEHLLGLLEAAEQKIWEMQDASDRNAARLAASLAQLEKHKEQLDETLDELDITRKQLTAAQARALEQERLLASERAKLARAGVSTTEAEADFLGGVDDIFAELEVGRQDEMVKLAGTPRPAAVPTPVAVEDDGSGVLDVRPGPRIVVEAIDGDGWETNAGAQEETVPRAKAPGSAHGAGSGSGRS